MGFFDPWNNKDKNKALRWANGAKKNQGNLLDVVHLANDDDVKKAALERITDPYLLAKVAGNPVNPSFIRGIAVFKLLNHTYITEKKTKYLEYKDIIPALDSVTDPETVRLLAKHCHRGSVSKLKDNDLIYKIVTAEYDSDFFNSTALFDEDQYNAFWADVYFQPRSSCFNECAELLINNLTDESLALDIFRKTRYSDVEYKTRDILISSGAADPKELICDDTLSCEKRMKLIARIDDDDFLLSYAKDDSRTLQIRKEIANKFQDPEIRKDFCKTLSTHEWVFDHADATALGENQLIERRYYCKFCGAPRSTEETV